MGDNVAKQDDGIASSIGSSPFLSCLQLCLYRGLCALFLLYTIISGSMDHLPAPYYMYLTNWMAMLNFCYFTTAAVLLLLPSSVVMRKVAYHLNQICLPNSITVALMFWLMVYPHLTGTSHMMSSYTYFRAIVDHGGTLVLLLVDFAISRTVFQISHVYWPALIFIYIPVSAIYTINIQEIYPGLTYRDLTSVGFVIFASVTTLVSFVILVYLVPKYKRAGKYAKDIHMNSLLMS